MISNYMFNQIRQLRDQGLNKSQIAKKLNICRQTVAKYIATNSPPKYSPREKSGKEDIFSPFRQRVKSLLDPSLALTAVEIYEIIKQEGFKGSERTVRRKVSEFRAEVPKERFFEQEYENGEQSQYDFKERVRLPFSDGERVVYLHYSTLPKSNRYFIKSYPGKTFECFMDGIHSFFEFIGGMTKNIRFDNLSPCVRKIHPRGKRDYTPAFQKAIEYYDFGLLPCSPGKGNEKGDVEREIRTHMRRIKNLIKIEGTVFESFNHLNQWLLEYIERRTTDKVMEAFKEERQTLLPVPKREESILCRIEDSTVTAFGTARMGTHCYSVPDWGIKGKCRLVRGPYDVKIYQKSAPFKLMATHPLKEGDSILLEHVISSLVKKPQAMIRWRHRDILFPRPIFKKFYQRLKKQCPDDAIRDFLKSINLIHHVDRSELEVGMDLVLETDSDNLYEELCSLLVKERRPGQLLNLETKLNQKKLRPNLEVFDQLIPKGGSQ